MAAPFSDERDPRPLGQRRVEERLGDGQRLVGAVDQHGARLHAAPARATSRLPGERTRVGAGGPLPCGRAAAAQDQDRLLGRRLRESVEERPPAAGHEAFDVDEHDARVASIDAQQVQVLVEGEVGLVADADEAREADAVPRATASWARA